MASQKQKRSSAAAKASAKANKTAKGKSSRPSGSDKNPIRREVWAVVCLLLGVFTLLGFFDLNAAFLDLLSNLFKGLIGPGFYILPVSFLMAFVILLTHDGRPVRLRVTCTFLLSILGGSLVQLFGGWEPEPWGFDMLPELWLRGIDMDAAGVLSGLLAQFLEMLISRLGAILLLLAAFALVLITALNMTVLSIIRAIQNRPRREYAPPQREHPDAAQTIVNHVATKQIQRDERRQAARVSDFDLPVDEPPLKGGRAQEKAMEKPKKTGGKPISPDAYLTDKPVPKEPQPEVQPQQLELPLEPQAQEDAPISLEDYRQQFDSLVRQMSPPKPEEVLPKQFPPLVMEKPVEAKAAAPKEELPPLVVPQEKPLKKEEVHQAAAKIQQEIAQTEQVPEYQFPPLELLRSGDGKLVDGTEEMRQNAQRLSDTLTSFGIEAQIVNVTRGPTVTRYELELNRGVKLSKVTNLADDIALSLGSSGVRIAAIPDKISVVGIEVPNRAVSTILARDVIDSPEFRKSKSRISFAVGKDIGGSRIIGNIAKLPHMLIAGTTGSGKSVCMNSLIISLLYKAKPDEVKLIMVDPKMVELGVYNGIPHLLIPVVTDPKKAAGALQWAVTEMMRRYRLMADTGVRDLDSFNKVAAGSDEFDPMPQIVVVIDELADLMLVAAKEVEESICRVAQMGRAAGIHLVIATQRPSADVITGLMKANIPSRIAFAVASAMESRIILDTAGAEKLVGKGDMLYAPLGEGKPKRVQGCFITDDEVQAVVDFIKKSGSAEYSDEILSEIDKKAAQSGKGGSAASASASVEPDQQEGDEMLPAAVEVLLEMGQASVSMLQRRLKLGYARAARIMDEMEEKGIVGPFEGSKPRQMLITREQWEQMKDGGVPADFNQAVEDEIP